MPRIRVAIPIYGEVLREAIKQRMNIEVFAEKIGRTRAAVHDWIKKDEIPPKQLSEVVGILGLTAEEVKAIGRKEPTPMHLRREIAELSRENQKLRNMIKEWMG